MQPCEGGLHSTERDVPFLNVDQHCYPFAVQGSGDSGFLPIMVGDQVVPVVVREAPGQRIVSEGAPGVALLFDAAVGHSDVKVTLDLHLPDASAGGEALGGENLWGFTEAAGTCRIAYFVFHPLCRSEVVWETEIIAGCVQIKH